jgi:chromosome segregation ATPase
MSDEREQIEDPATIGGLGDLIQESPLVQRLRAEIASLRNALDTAERQRDGYKAEMDRLQDALVALMDTADQMALGDKSVTRAGHVRHAVENGRRALAGVEPI